METFCVVSVRTRACVFVFDVIYVYYIFVPIYLLLFFVSFSTLSST